MSMMGDATSLKSQVRKAVKDKWHPEVSVCASSGMHASPYRGFESYKDAQTPRDHRDIIGDTDPEGSTLQVVAAAGSLKQVS
jgi:hypothetical protein